MGLVANCRTFTTNTTIRLRKCANNTFTMLLKRLDTWNYTYHCKIRNLSSERYTKKPATAKSNMASAVNKALPPNDVTHSKSPIEGATYEKRVYKSYKSLGFSAILKKKIPSKFFFNF